MRTNHALRLLPLFFLGAAACSAESTPPVANAEDGEDATEATHTTPEALTTGPDLTVTAVTGPPSTTGSFTANVTVCNVGTVPVGATNVDLFLSTDAAITIADNHVGGTWVPPLGPGVCSVVNVPANAPPLTGAFYLGAIVDAANTIAESVETNNARAGALIGVGYGPDLIVTAATAPASVAGPYTVATTVCNQGTAPSAGTVIELHLSTDAAITIADAFGGSGDVPGLGAGQCASISIPGIMPPSQGPFYLGAIVDARNTLPELIETNNAFTGRLTGFGLGADLVVTAVNAPPSIDGGGFAASAAVCNQGTSPSYQTAVSLFFSTDTVITTADALAGSGTVANLQPGQCTLVNVSGNAAVAPGAYHLGAIVDPQNTVPELIETNNTSAGKVVGVGYGPDLIVTAVTGPASIANGSFTATTTVCNQGTAGSNGGAVELHFSSDTSITIADPFAGGTILPFLNAGQCTTITVNGYAPPPGNGAYYLGAIVDPGQTVSELVETNNTFSGKLVGVGFGPDLIVTKVSGPPNIANNGFTGVATVCNQGTTSSYGAAVELHLSTDTTITTSDPFAGGAALPSLAAGQCADVSIMSYAPVPPGGGPLYLGAIVDPGQMVAELIETNNTLAGKLTGIGYGPDLFISAVNGPTSIIQGPFTAAVSVCNQGNEPSNGSELELFFSPDTTITRDDAFAGQAPVPSIAPAACAVVSVSGNAPPLTGAYYLGAMVDATAFPSELITTNNTSPGRLVGLGFGPDLVVRSVTAPPSIGMAPATVTATVCNQGTVMASESFVELLLSTDATITTSDQLVGQGFAPTLAAGQCAAVSVMAQPPPLTGAYYVGAIVDPMSVVFELIETNNASAGRLVGLGSGPDLVVSLTSPATVIAGQPLAVTTTVCNQGTTASGPTSVELHLSTDATITGSDVFGGAAYVAPLAAGQCSTLPIAGSALVPPGSYYAGAVVDPQNSVAELIEINDVSTARPLTVQ